MKNEGPVILFLYTELAEYFLACIEELVKRNTNVHIVHWPVNSEAPFEFRKLNHVQFYDRAKHDDQALKYLYHKIQPHIVLTSGWVDKGYLNISKMARQKIPAVLLLDNHWNGTLKQRIVGLLSRWVIRDKFNCAWVPGAPQKEYARKLGFDTIKTGFYCADTTLFSEFQKKYKAEKDSQNPKRLLFVGRYLDFKGIFELWQVFEELHARQFSDWELWCVGTGDFWDQRIQSDGIQHFGFVQPAELGEIIRQSSVFVLPSHREPWGVVVHEMAAAGMPLVCSESIGAATRFLEEGQNGFFHKPADQESLKSALTKVMSLPQDKFNQMSQDSVKLAGEISPETWVNTLFELL